ncbi:MAG: outer membrane protein assembly factor BamE [Ectothiorhodospiraceae bacterium]|nr:outer membrane protein assembly factor BamE [Ectothiorhodospiraceae bacterium]MCH8506090.1 outer membrane protein assembly factor BamE [Ectothiorhodospiraceae bacterium]
MFRLMTILLLAAGSVFTLQACSISNLPFVYQPDVQQGNIITEDMVSQLRPGMTKRQVRYVMGSPAIEDMFRNNRWDYIHTQQAGGGGEPQRLTVLFDDSERLVDLQGDLAPENWAADS